WRHDVAVPNPVAIGLAPGREPGMEATVNELGLQDSNVAVQVAVNGVAQLKRADVAGEPEAGYLPVGVDSGVGAARAMDCDDAFVDSRQRVLEFALDGTAV